MKTHTKQLACDGTRIGSVDALFEYAKEILGDNWIFTHSEGSKNSKLVFRDPSGSGDQGWRFVSSTDVPHLISNGTDNTSYSQSSKASIERTEFTGVVWEGDSGSVGLGWISDDGRLVTWYLLVKFIGTHLNKDLYGVSIVGDSQNSIIAHGGTNIGFCNVYTSKIVGSGVYLHPLLDPVSGLTSADVFGVRSMDSMDYGTTGTIVKQGTTSYMSAVGLSTAGNNAPNVLFVKM